MADFLVQYCYGCAGMFGESTTNMEQQPPEGDLGIRGESQRPQHGRFNPADSASDVEFAIHFAARSGNYVEVQRLVSAGVDLDIKDGNGRTALHLASALGNEAICRLLLEKNAKVGIADKDGKTALRAAAEARHGMIVKLMSSWHHVPRTPLAPLSNPRVASSAVNTNKPPSAWVPEANANLPIPTQLAYMDENGARLSCTGTDENCTAASSKPQSSHLHETESPIRRVAGASFLENCLEDNVDDRDLKDRWTMGVRHSEVASERGTPRVLYLI